MKPALVWLAVVAMSAGCPREQAGPDAGNEAPCEPATQLELVDGPAGPAIEPGDAPAGIERCDVFTFNRTAAVACENGGCNPSAQECAVDEDCGGGLHCVGCRCLDAVPCGSDGDCTAGEACLCSAGAQLEGGGFAGLVEASICVPAQCRTNADCADGCGVVVDGCGNPLALQCRDHGACKSDADCTGDRPVCAGDVDGGWSCALTTQCE